MPDSRPRLPGRGAVKQAGFRRLKGSSKCVKGSQPGTIPIRAPSVDEPVMLMLLALWTENPGVKGAPVWAWVTPEICQPSVASLLKAFPQANFGVL